MEIVLLKEDLSQADTGGAYRDVIAHIVIDETLPRIKQRQSLIAEMLSLYLDPLEFRAEWTDDIAHKIAETLEQLDAL